MKEPVSASGPLRLMEWLICVILFLLPLMYCPLFLFAFTSSKLVFFSLTSSVIGGLTAWIFLTHPGMGKNLRKNKLFLFGACFYFLSYFVSVLHSINSGYSFWGSFERGTGGVSMILLFIFTVSTYVALRLGGREFLKKALAASFAGGVILALSVTFSSEGFSLLHGILSQSSGGGLLGNSSLTGAYLLFNIFLGLVLYTRAVARKGKVFIALGVMLIIFSPIFINFHFASAKGFVSLIGSARGALLGVMCGILVTVSSYLAFSQKKAQKIAGITLCSLVALTAITFGVILLNPGSSVHSRFTQLASDTRFRFWNIAIEASKVHPFLGYGPETFDVPFHTLFDPGIIVSEGRLDIVLDRPHNVLLEHTVNGGLLLLCAYIVYLLSIGLGFIGGVRRGQFTRAEGAIFLGALAGWFIQNQFVFDSLASLVMLGFLTSISLSSSTNENQEEKMVSHLTESKKYVTMGSIVLITIAAIIYFSILPGVKAASLKKMYNMSPIERAKEWQGLSGVSPIGNVSDTAFFANELYQKYKSELPKIKEANEENKENIIADIDAAIIYFKSLIVADGYARQNYTLTILVPKFYLLKFSIQHSLTKEEFSDMEAFARHAQELSPNDPEAYWVMSQIFFIENKTDDAKQALSDAATLAPQVRTSYDIMLNIGAATRDQKYFLEVLKRAKAAIPGFQVKNSV